MIETKSAPTSPRITPQSRDGQAPQRIQLSRKKGWRKPPNAVVVARPTRWGNPFRVTADDSREAVVRDFDAHLSARRHPWPGWTDLLNFPTDDEIRTHLAGRDLGCWCPLDQPCHADVLLGIANDTSPVSDPQRRSGE